jgi:hypothetical protein
MAGQDPCLGLLPPALRAQIERSYPAYRQVSTSDYSAEDLAASTGDDAACPGIASADVNADGVSDYGVVMTAPSGHTLLIGARSGKAASWTLDELTDLGRDGPSRLYAEPLEPGDYTDLFASDDAPDEFTPEPGRVRHYRSRRPGFIAGGMEASGIAFFFTGRRWVHLWLSD